MAYAQDTITSANAPNALATVLDGLLLAAGWDVVETITPAGTFSPNTKVYQSDAADNQCGYDWFLVIMWKGTGTEAQMEIMAGGAYDVGTHVLSQIAGSMDGTGTGSGSNSPYAEAVTGAHMQSRAVNVATNLTTTFTSHGASNNKPWFATVVPSSAFAYWASVTLDHVSLFTTIVDPSASGNPFFFAASLDVDPDYSALGFVATNPIIQYAKAAGLSASVIGTGATDTDHRDPRTIYADNVGAVLPTLTTDYIPAYAWRDAIYLRGVDAAGGTPAWPTNLAFGNGWHIGDGIDYYRVFGGSIGDTVEIDSATYVISGPIVGSQASGGVSSTQVCIAVLVE